MLENLLRFLLDVSIRSGNSQVRETRRGKSERFLDFSDGLPKSGPNFSAVGFSIVLRHSVEREEIPLVETEEGESRCDRTGKRAISSGTLSDADDRQRRSSLSRAERIERRTSVVVGEENEKSRRIDSNGVRRRIPNEKVHVEGERKVSSGKKEKTFFRWRKNFFRFRSVWRR